MRRRLSDLDLGAGPPKEAPSPASDAPPHDLGFGSVVSRESEQRLLNRDGTFNVQRKGLGVLESQSTYHFLLDISWPRFLAIVSLAYIAANAVFALAYMALGPEALPGLESEGVSSGFPAYFFFAVHTLATIGYGHVLPRGLAANLLVVLESILSLLLFGIAAGLMFARFARPNARILFSDVAVVAPFGGGQAFMFRVVNGRDNQLVELQARVIFARRKESGGREYYPLGLERERVVFFPLAWTVVHPIDESSPLHGVDASALAAQEAEFLVLLTGFDETFSQTVHARSSYVAEEVLWGRRFANMFQYSGEDRRLGVDVDRLSETTDG